MMPGLARAATLGTQVALFSSSIPLKMGQIRILGWASIALVLTVISAVIAFGDLPAAASSVAHSVFLGSLLLFLALLLAAFMRKSPRR